MKRKILLTIVALTIILAGCGQPKLTTLELVPFTSQALSIRGLAPEGWMKVNPGHFAGISGRSISFSMRSI